MVTIPINSQLTLRTYTIDDAEALFAAIDTNRKHLNPWLNWVKATTKPEHSLQFIEHSIHQVKMQEALPMGIFYNDKVIGGIGMHQWDQSLKKAQIGYWITKEYEGKGIMTAAVQHFVHFLFSKAGLNKVEIHFIPSNKRSAKIAERLGAKVEGVLRQSYLQNGLADDIVITGLLKSEWNPAVLTP